MIDEVRTARTLGVTSTLSPADRYQLAQLRTSDGYRVLLDVMEQACIEQEALLINRDVTEPSRILAEHAKTQAMWQVFTHLQEKVNREASLQHEHLFAAMPEPLTQQQLEDEETLDPTRHAPEPEQRPT